MLLIQLLDRCCLDYSSRQPSAQHARFSRPPPASASNERSSGSPRCSSATRRLEHPCCSVATPAYARSSCICSTTASACHTRSSPFSSTACRPRGHHGRRYTRIPGSTVSSTSCTLWLPCPTTSTVLRPGISSPHTSWRNAPSIPTTIPCACALPTASTSAANP